jgi:hypothetical protein
MAEYALLQAGRVRRRAHDQSDADSMPRPRLLSNDEFDYNAARPERTPKKGIRSSW